MNTDATNDTKNTGGKGIAGSDLLDFLDGLGKNNNAKWKLSIKPWGVYLDKSSSDGFDTASECLRNTFLRSNTKISGCEPKAKTWKEMIDNAEDADAHALTRSAGSGLTDTQRLNWLESNKTVRVEWWEDAQFRDYCMILLFDENKGMKEVNDHFQHYDLREAIDYAIEQISIQNNEVSHVVRHERS